MDYAKFVRKDMPLAVPHQKPPSKYASHPYPVLVDEDVLDTTLKPLNISVTRSLIEDNLQPILTPLDVVVINVVKPIETYLGYGESRIALLIKPLDVVVTNKVKPIEVYQAYETELLKPNIKPLAVKVKNVFQVIPYNNSSEKIELNVKPLNVVVTKVKG